MKEKNIHVNYDFENGLTSIPLSHIKVKKVISLSDEGCKYLDLMGADIILAFSEDGKLVNIELSGFDH